MLESKEIIELGILSIFEKRWETKTKVRRENLRRWKIRGEAVKVKKVKKWQFNRRLRNEMDTWLVMLGRKKMRGLKSYLFVFCGRRLSDQMSLSYLQAIGFGVYREVVHRTRWIEISAIPYVIHFFFFHEIFFNIFYSLILTL